VGLLACACCASERTPLCQCCEPLARREAAEFPEVVRDAVAAFSELLGLTASVTSGTLAENHRPGPRDLEVGRHLRAIVALGKLLVPLVETATHLPAPGGGEVVHRAHALAVLLQPSKGAEACAVARVIDASAQLRLFLNLGVLNSGAGQQLAHVLLDDVREQFGAVERLISDRCNAGDSTDSPRGV
jgi:hypothetical protein